MSQRIDNIRAAYHARMTAEVKRLQADSLEDAIQTVQELQEQYGCDELYETLGFTSSTLMEGLQSLINAYTK